MTHAFSNLIQNTGALQKQADVISSKEKMPIHIRSIINNILIAFLRTIVIYTSSIPSLHPEKHCI